ncbi:MAG: RDD family protein [Gammaproteobacteria bacterium]|nr:RDD family protein [Gammaproteobacteria bacterium]
MTIPSSDNTPATLIKRLLAICYDLLLLIALLFTVGVIAAGIFTFTVNHGNAITDTHPAYPVYRMFILTLLLITAFLFYGWFWTHGGQTLGMKTWKIKLISTDNQPISWSQALLRYLAVFLSWGVCGLGFIWALFNKEKKTWHDMLSNTRLIKLDP